jgi:amidophosphoribosyltransferase
VFDGLYVTGDIDDAYLSALEASRSDSAKQEQSAGDHALVGVHNQDDIDD